MCAIVTRRSYTRQERKKERKWNYFLRGTTIKAIIKLLFCINGANFLKKKNDITLTVTGTNNSLGKR